MVKNNKQNTVILLNTVVLLNKRYSSKIIAKIKNTLHTAIQTGKPRFCVIS